MAAVDFEVFKFAWRIDSVSGRYDFMHKDTRIITSVCQPYRPEDVHRARVDVESIIERSECFCRSKTIDRERASLYR